jgi:hypothetical protein
LIAFINFHIADIHLKDHKIDSLRKHNTKKKQRSKKIIKLKVINNIIIMEYYDQLKAAEEKREAKKKKLIYKKRRKRESKRERIIRGDRSDYHYLIKIMIANRITISDNLLRNQLRRKGRLYRRIIK